MSNVSFRIKQDKAELWKQNVTVTSVAVATTKFLFGMCDCAVDHDVGTGNFSIVKGLLHVCRHAHVRSHVLPVMYCCSCPNQIFKCIVLLHLTIVLKGSPSAEADFQGVSNLQVHRLKKERKTLSTCTAI